MVNQGLPAAMQALGDELAHVMDPLAIDAGANLPARLASARDQAEAKAWASLAGYKFMMFGYWAAIWVHLNHLIGDGRPNPFRDIVHAARRKGTDG